jgi:hypothetical protein
MHLLPSHAMLYSRTGWGSAGPGGGPISGPSDDQSSFFVMPTTHSGVWTDISPSTSRPDRTKGMSVMLLASTPPYVRVLVVGGADPVTNNTYEMIDVTALSPATAWSTCAVFPDGEHRSLASLVLLPDGNVFMCGGIQRTNSPSAMFSPNTNVWAPMASMPIIRDYHSVAFLLPSAQVAVAGWYSDTIEIFDPPYLYAGARPTIAAAPAVVGYDEFFTIDTPDGTSINRVVLARPMSVTHQTDTEQRIVELGLQHDKVDARKIHLKSPAGTTPRSMTPQGYYMMFAVTDDGRVSEATWILLKHRVKLTAAQCLTLRATRDQKVALLDYLLVRWGDPHDVHPVIRAHMETLGHQIAQIDNQLRDGGCDE